MEEMSKPLFASTGALLSHVDAFDVAHVARVDEAAKVCAEHNERRAEGASKIYPGQDEVETPARLNSESRDKFTMGVDYDKARKMGEQGWSEGLPNMRQAIRMARAPYERSVIYEMPADVQGATVDPAAYFAGVPEAFHTPTEIATVALGYDAVEVVFNAFVSANVEAEVIYARGATGILIAHVCAMSAIPCRIVTTFAVSSGWGVAPPADFAFVLSDWDEPLDFPLITFWLCHAAATRRLGFRLLDTASLQLSREGYGSPRNSMYKTGDRFKRIQINHGLSRSQLQSPDAAIDEIIKLLVSEGKVVEA